MKDIDITVLFAVFYEMLGPLLWILVVAILAGTLAFGLLLVRERGLHPARLVRMQFLGLLGGAAALWLMARVSSSGFTDAGGPVNWLLIALVFVLGWVGTSVILYTLVGWLGGRLRCCPQAG